jgi:CubicO group peptidase (beta-lactamase class C family)
MLGHGPSRARPGGALLVAAVLAAAVAGAGIPAGFPAAAASVEPGVDGVIDAARAAISRTMVEQDIPGVAVALVDGDQALWLEGFGRTRRDGGRPITPDTIFSVQSMSKTFTATAVLIAVQEGRLDLDEPITTYLPEFTVHSAFEDHPERKLTLRILLAHTGGFTHEAPVGNNNELDPGTWEEHVRSISDTWLRFPVGSGYAYSNLDIDLAAHVLERVYGEPFPALMERMVLGPIGMAHSTFDRARIRSIEDRALGHTRPWPVMPVDVPMTASGGLYASAADLARFLTFQLGAGTIDGRVVLDAALMDEMRTIPEPFAGDSAGYALGVARTRWRAGGNADLFDHGGGGFGFIADLWWLPQLDLGIAILTNSADDEVQGGLALSILRDLVDTPGSSYEQRLLALPRQDPPVEPTSNFLPPAGFADLVAGAAMPEDEEGSGSESWAAYVGDYRAARWGALITMVPPERFLIDGDRAFYESSETGTAVRHPLVEVAPGVFLTDAGETVDFSGAAPTYRSVDLVRVTGGPAPWQWAFLGGAALAAAASLVAGVGSGVLRLVRRGRPGDGGSGGLGVLGGLTVGTLSSVTAVAALASVALIAVMPLSVDSGFLGWLQLPTAERLLLHVPLALTILTIGLAAVAAVGWRRGWWSRSARLRLGALLVASVLLVAQLAAWRLIGWGLF